MQKQKIAKRLVYLALALIFLAFAPVIALSAEDDFVIENGVLIEYTGTEADVTIPDGVTGIGDWAFDDCTSLVSIVITDTVTKISDVAFMGCQKLTEIIVSENNSNYSSIDGVLFNKDKTKLVLYPRAKPETSYDIPNSVTTIWNRAFNGSELTSVTIPDSVKSIEYKSFNDCASLTSIMIPYSVISMNLDGAFPGCQSLNEIIVDTNNPVFFSIDGVLFTKDKISLIRYPAGNPATSYNVPDGVTRIYDWAFGASTALESIVIPDSVTWISYGAFENCTSLKSIVIPDSVTMIDGNVFNGCVSLTSVMLPESIKIIVGFEGCTLLASIVIPNSATTIAEFAFLNCTSLTSIVIPDSVTVIAFGAFRNCTSLESIIIPDSVTEIEDWAFFGCDNLTIYGKAGSYAEEYAEENEIKFQELP